MARRLIGKRLVYTNRGVRLSAFITETEAYLGLDDPASHAFRGRRGRNESMYAEGGTVYVYFTYGHHFMFNVAVGPGEFPAAVLVRAAWPEEGLEHMCARRGLADPRKLLRGPGNLTRAFGIDKSLDGTKLCGPEIWFETARLAGVIKQSGRIGIGEQGADRLWRFYLAGHPSVSGPRTTAI